MIIDIKDNLNNEEFLETVHLDATVYSNLLEKNFLIVSSSRKQDNFYWFQCQFTKSNFMHLLGIKSITLKPDQFFDKAFDYDANDANRLMLSDCAPSRNHDRKTLNRKESSAKSLFAIEDARYLKVGMQDKITKYVMFDYASITMVTRWTILR